MHHLHRSQKLEVFDGSSEFEYAASWLDVVKGYDNEILFHLGKANMVADALSRKTVCSSIQDTCLRMTVTSPLMDLIKEAQVEGLKKKLEN